MYLGKFSLEFVAYKFSLTRHWQGYATSFSTTLVRYISTKPNNQPFQELYKPLLRGTSSRSLTRRNLHRTNIMGSSISRGRKFSPTKNESSKNPTALVGHAKFSCADPSRQSEQYIEGVVCKESELEENEMKVVNLGEDDGKVLLVKQKGKISAVGTKCTHYGAPLVNGHLGDGRVRCQWHGACFNISTGDIEDFPGLDSLPCYEVKISNGDVIVRADKELLKNNKRVRPFISTIKPTIATYIVVGGGPAGTTCVENLRALGYEGRLMLITADNYLPYDRIKLSKSFDGNLKNLILRPMEFYQERNIEVIMGTKLTTLDTAQKKAVLDNGNSLKYDKIFLATGSSPQKLVVPGSKLNNIFELRSAEDFLSIKEALTGICKVVILGTSFIGMEAAAASIGRASSVTVVGKDVPFKSVFGSIIGNRIMKLFQEKNIKFQLNTTIERFEGENDNLKAVQLTNGTKLPADICIVGIGVSSNTDYLNISEIELESNGTISVNEYLETSCPDVYAGGDIAFAPVLGVKASIGHWGLASYHGHIAAYNMMDQKKPLRTIPFFWSMLFGKSFRYTGYTKEFDDVVIDGSVDDLKFIAFYCSGDNVVAVAEVGRDPLSAKFAENLYEGKQLKKNEISNWLS